jgi:acyl-CoA thioesterase-1
MPSASRIDRSRRAVLAGAAATLTVGAARAAARPNSAPPVVTILGDSVTAGFGLAAADALPIQLQAALARLGLHAEVRGAGVSGDTTADGRARAGFSVQPDTAVCLVALGGNDLLQGVEPANVRANLIDIVRALKARRMAVVLAGLTAPPRIGAAYARAFDAAFPAAARASGAILYPDLFAGVGRDMRFLQGDGVHPNPAGVKLIAARLAPVIAQTLRARR